MKRGNFMNATQLTTNTKTTPQVTGRTLLLALGYGIGLGVALGVLTGFGLPRVVPALSSIEWLSTIITTELYLSLIAGHIIAFGGFWQMRQRLQIGRTPWRNVGMAFLLWLAMWAVFVVIYMVLSSSVAVVSEMGKAILKIGSLYGRLEGASLGLMTLAIIQPVLITPLAEEIIFRGSLYGWLRSKLNANLTILITATLFALYHPLIYLWPIVFVFGLLSGWVRERTKSLTPFLIIHMLNSIAMIAAAYFITGWRV
jgi:membrane protease YdiL (CAAX protease family)